MYIVELQENVWLADWNGDPGRTTKIENSKRFHNENAAKLAMKKARKYRKFQKALIKKI